MQTAAVTSTTIRWRRSCCCRWSTSLELCLESQQPITVASPTSGWRNLGHGSSVLGFKQYKCDDRYFVPFYRHFVGKRTTEASLKSLDRLDHDHSVFHLDSLCCWCNTDKEDRSLLLLLLSTNQPPAPQSSKIHQGSKTSERTKILE